MSDVSTYYFRQIQYRHNYLIVETIHPSILSDMSLPSHWADSHSSPSWRKGGDTWYYISSPRPAKSTLGSAMPPPDDNRKNHVYWSGSDPTTWRRPEKPRLLIQPQLPPIDDIIQPKLISRSNNPGDSTRDRVVHPEVSRGLPTFAPHDAIWGPNVHAKYKHSTVGAKIVIYPNWCREIVSPFGNLTLAVFQGYNTEMDAMHTYLVATSIGPRLTHGLHRWCVCPHPKDLLHLHPRRNSPVHPTSIGSFDWFASGPLWSRLVKIFDPCCYGVTFDLLLSGLRSSSFTSFIVTCSCTLFYW